MCGIPRLVYNICGHCGTPARNSVLKHLYMCSVVDPGLSITYPDVMAHLQGSVVDPGLSITYVDIVAHLQETVY